ncbi:MAG TPA: DUF4424 family protein [Bdellovibrionota bacterium]|nr:DUF4424 family protein [Bdellovibrionota bacterium]
MRRNPTLLSLLALLAAPAAANDSSASLDGSNLGFEKSENIEMLSEDLRISYKETSVRYEFRNSGAGEIRTVVAFPLPRMHASTPDHGLGEISLWEKAPSHRSLANPFAFRVRVDGVDVVPQLALVTAEIDDDAPVELNTRKHVFKDASRNIPLDGTEGRWPTEYRYFWHQAFPPGKIVTVEHSYRTVPGNPRASYCMEPDFQRALEKRKAEILATESEEKRGRWLHYTGQVHVGYILKTGANWKGPIRKFRLTIDKAHPKDLVSTCFKGLKKKSATRFVAELTDFVPTEDLNILLVRHEY